MVQILAHKAVLSSASSIFQELLLINSNSNPILYLKVVKHAELESILQFIYLGEAKVLENRLDLFVSASKELKIKELNKSGGSYKCIQGIENQGPKQEAGRIRKHIQGIKQKARR